MLNIFKPHRIASFFETPPQIIFQTATEPQITEIAEKVRVPPYHNFSDRLRRPVTAPQTALQKIFQTVTAPRTAAAYPNHRTANRGSKMFTTALYALSRIPDGMYVFAGNTNDRNDYFVMSTAPFTTTQNTRIEFYLYLAGIEGRFRVCVDDLTTCPFESLGKNIKIDSRKWRNGFVDVPAGTHTVRAVIVYSKEF